MSRLKKEAKAQAQDEELADGDAGNEKPARAPAPSAAAESSTAFADSWFISRLTFSWVQRVVQLGRRKKLSEGKLELAEAENAELCYQQFLSKWNLELAEHATNPKRKPSLLRALWRTFWHRFVVAAICKLLWGVFLLLGTSQTC